VALEIEGVEEALVVLVEEVEVARQEEDVVVHAGEVLEVDSKAAKQSLLKDIVTMASS
jgi:hypothetical protein